MRNLVIAMLMLGVSSVAFGALTTSIDLSLDTSYTWMDTTSFRTHIFSPDASPNGRNLLMNFQYAGTSTITTGNQGASGAVGDEALQIGTTNTGTPEAPVYVADSAFAVMKWLFDGNPCDDLSGLSEPWNDFSVYAKVEMDIKILDNDGGACLTRVSGPWDMTRTGTDDLLLKVYMLTPGTTGGQTLVGSFTAPGFFSNTAWQHVVFEYNMRNMSFTVDGVTQTAVATGDMWARGYPDGSVSSTQWWFGHNSGANNPNALFDNAKLTTPEPMTIGLLGLGAALIRRKK